MIVRLYLSLNEVKFVNKKVNIVRLTTPMHGLVRVNIRYQAVAIRIQTKVHLTYTTPHVEKANQ